MELSIGLEHHGVATFPTDGPAARWCVATRSLKCHKLMDSTRILGASLMAASSRRNS